jgi:hypothetical protein
MHCAVGIVKVDRVKPSMAGDKGECRVVAGDKHGLLFLILVDVEFAGAIGADYQSDQIALPRSKDGERIDGFKCSKRQPVGMGLGRAAGRFKP